jgi:hypothetical protein
MLTMAKLDIIGAGGTYTWDRVDQKIRRHVMPLIAPHTATNTAQCL